MNRARVSLLAALAAAAAIGVTFVYIRSAEHTSKQTSDATDVERDPLQRACLDALAVLPPDTWLSHRTQDGMLALSRKQAHAAAERRRSAGGVPSLREYAKYVESDPAFQPRPRRIAAANAAIVRGEYHPEFDPLRLDVFDAGSVDALLWAALDAGEYPPEERRGARLAFARMAGEDVAGAKVDEATVFDRRCGMYEVALIQSLVGSDGLTRAQGQAVLALCSRRIRGWTAPGLAAMVAVQAFGDETEDGEGARFTDRTRAREVLDRLDESFSGALAAILTPTQSAQLRAAGYGSEELWRRRCWQYAPLYSEDWPTDPRPKVIRRPGPDEIDRIQGQPPAW